MFVCFCLLAARLQQTRRGRQLTISDMSGLLLVCLRTLQHMNMSMSLTAPSGLAARSSDAAVVGCVDKSKSTTVYYCIPRPTRPGATQTWFWEIQPGDPTRLGQINVKNKAHRQSIPAARSQSKKARPHHHPTGFRGPARLPDPTRTDFCDDLPGRATQQQSKLPGSGRTGRVPGSPGTSRYWPLSLIGLPVAICHMMRSLLLQHVRSNRSEM